ncbi:hypothetical protein C2845_PM04G02540 [Panicum miliaceum]|uniref:Uncharacterized protein n=1 Tax=Panicum miliaceum TaxID=4540 RepID=A0A3L6QRX3_PANMI|nr:hypothetical protein C2845_PM04G02540 [Panicum miliaceum]
MMVSLLQSYEVDTRPLPPPACELHRGRARRPCSASSATSGPLAPSSPASSPRSPPPSAPFDSRAILHKYSYGCGHPDFAFVVWDPIMNERRELPRLPPGRPRCLCAAVAAGACDHLDCHRGPFVVVFVGTENDDMFTYVYSSQAASGVWSKPVSAKHPGFPVTVPVWRLERSALAGNAHYFVLENSDRILK